ncbi:MAG: hypothetical protein C4523_15025, partial [Myxococcales bacterium]
SADATTFTILARLETLSEETDSTDTRTAITAKARALVAEPPFNRRTWHIAGVPVIKSDLVNTQKSESHKFELMIFSMLAVVLYFIFRTFSGTFVTLFAVQAGVFVLMAGHYLSGIPLTMVSTILTPLMLIYGISSSVHLQTHYALHSGLGAERNAALKAAIVATFVPCLFNSITTSVGFGSNLVSTIRPIREFSLFATSGVMLVFVVVFLIVPSVLSYFPKPGARTIRANESGWRVYLLEGVVHLILHKRKWVVGVSLLFFFVSIYGISRIRVETDLVRHFREDAPIRVSHDFIDKNLSGISGLEVVIDTKADGGMKDPEVIAKIEELTEYLRQREPAVTSIVSIDNLYKRINMALHADDPTWKKIPATREEAAQFLLLYSMSGPESDIYNFVSDDYRYGRISARLHTLTSTDLRHLVERIKAKTHQVFAPLEARGIYVNPTGAAVLYANMDGSMVEGQIRSFSLSLFMIGLMMILVAGELGLGLVSLIPNLMPIAYMMGLMGFLNYALDSTTAMVAPIALGIAVDSTIHFMVRYRREFLATRDYELAAVNSVRIIGRAMLGTSLPLMLGFGVLCTSEFFPIYVFGLLSAIVVGLAMWFDLLLTPICMMLYKPKYRQAGLMDIFD